MRIRVFLLASLLLFCSVLSVPANGDSVSAPAGVGALLETGKMYPVALSLVPGFAREPDAWTETSLERATYTVCMWADLIAYIGPDHHFSPDILADSWMGVSDGILYLLLRASGEYDIFMLYKPSDNARYAFFEMMERSEKIRAEDLLAQLCADRCWQNDPEEISAIASALADASK